MPIPVVFGVGVSAMAEQLTSNPDESIGSFRRTAMQAGVAHIQQRLPILNSTRLNC
jgi:hypothetical protein